MIQFFSFQEYLALIADRAKGFSYKVVSDNQKKRRKLLEVFWMTAIMRRNYELFGSFLCFEMMKRDINSLLWPYTAVTMLDEDKMCVWYVKELYVVKGMTCMKHKPIF